MNGMDAIGIGFVELEEVSPRRFRDADDLAGECDLPRHLTFQTVQCLFLQQLRESLVREIVNRDHPTLCHRAHESRQKIIRAEEDIAINQRHPSDVRRRRDRSIEARLGLTAEIENAQSGLRRQIAMKMRTEVGDTRIAEKIDLNVVAARDLVKKMIEIPADTGQRLVERPDVDSQTQL